MGLILTSLNPKTHVAGASAIGFVHGLSPESVREPTRCWKMLEVTGTRVWTRRLPAVSAFRDIPDSPRRRYCAGTFAGEDVRTWAGSLRLIQSATAEGAKPGRGKRKPGRSGSLEFAEDSLLVRRRGLRGAAGQRRRNRLSGLVDDLR